MLIIFNKLFQKIKHVFGGKTPSDHPYVLKHFEGIGMKIALLVIQYVYAVVKVWKKCLCCGIHLF